MAKTGSIPYLTNKSKSTFSSTVTWFRLRIGHFFYCDCLERRLSYNWIVFYTAPYMVHR
jgi:hypothetical protein